MTDERNDNEGRPGVYDDDRLLACALGLDDDPGLLAAAEEDAALAARLAAMRGDVAAVEKQVAAAVPAPDEGYADLTGDRWSGLREYLEPAASAAKPRHARRWWRVVAPVAAVLVLAVVAGTMALNQGGRSVMQDSAAEGSRSATDTTEFSGQKSTEDGGGGGVSSAEQPPQTAAQRVAAELDRFAVVVLARARQATGAIQRFAVLRVFKGAAPQMVELEVGDQPAVQGRLHLLMLDPLPVAAEPLGSPEPIPSPAATGGDVGLGEPLAVSYTYDGEHTMVRGFAVGTDPDTVTLPLP